MKNKDKFLIVVAGPTAVGKTTLSINLAKYFDTEIVSADSRQFYKELNIGTAKPSAKELGEVRHHCINNLSIKEDYDVGRYEAEALKALETIFSSRRMAILTGGSGLYIKAVTEGLDEMPETSSEIREALNKQYLEEGLDALNNLLLKADPEYYHQVDLNNPQRVIRALEVFRASGKPFSTFRKGKTGQRSFRLIKIGLERERHSLYNRIDERMDAMIEEGLFEEAKSLYSFRHHNALQTVGYKEIFDYIDGKYNRGEAIRLLKRNSRRYAKRQLTWFKKDIQMSWFHPEAEEKIIQYIEKQIQNLG